MRVAGWLEKGERLVGRLLGERLAASDGAAGVVKAREAADQQRAMLRELAAAGHARGGGRPPTVGPMIRAEVLKALSSGSLPRAEVVGLLAEAGYSRRTVNRLVRLMLNDGSVVHGDAGLHMLSLP